ncbi:hypothetical protein VNO78_20867 [Psophocarpus tetragonolobus]|uniref:Uncharacterized protein n=1 Tax=Psophocarpus tetragonolobus TaxID=3891 RepID=A0AAN9SA26_PSOTE
MSWIIEGVKMVAFMEAEVDDSSVKLKNREFEEKDGETVIGMQVKHEHEDVTKQSSRSRTQHNSLSRCLVYEISKIEAWARKGREEKKRNSRKRIFGVQILENQTTKCVADMDAQIKGEEQTHTLCRAEKGFCFFGYG